MTMITKRNRYSPSGYSVPHKYKMAAPSQSFVALCLFLNICCSIVIVLINKWIYTHYGFPNVTLTCIHFIVTTIGLLICHQFNVFQHKRLPVVGMLPLACTFCGFVVFTNLSLETNTVGTYQLIKSLTTPCIMLIQTQFYQKKFSLPVQLTVVRFFLNSLFNKTFRYLCKNWLQYISALFNVTSAHF
jgi:solute carrier family 35 protein E3